MATSIFDGPNTTDRDDEGRRSVGTVKSVCSPSSTPREQAIIRQMHNDLIPMHRECPLCDRIIAPDDGCPWCGACIRCCPNEELCTHAPYDPDASERD